MLRDIKVHFDGEILSAIEYKNDRSATAHVILQGAGNATKERYSALAQDLQARGSRVLLFDFSGHGQSSGSICDLTLKRRHDQALGVIEAVLPDRPKLSIVGFSMSGQTVADLTVSLASDINSIGLCSPAIYAKSAWNVPFTNEFSEIIRRDGSWTDSSALDAFGKYTGHAVLAVPDKDSVVPPSVTKVVREALSAESVLTDLVFPGADHRLGRWFERNAADRRTLVEALTGKT
ncbi:alpha/beta hydrolase [Streptomyces sp. NPDC058470]|uniref:alpha/beta hydrolase n=1 Tax=Streptomyces sp. NPDC058470 TaxID=3346515 RepID=UPI003664B084